MTIDNLRRICNVLRVRFDKEFHCRANDINGIWIWTEDSFDEILLDNIKLIVPQYDYEVVTWKKTNICFDIKLKLKTATD